MSWGTCYSASNNIHFNFPPIMADGRNYASWQPEAVVNDRIRKQEHITSNWEYRQYLTNNANEIMKFNTKESCYDLGLSTHIPQSENTNIIPVGNVPKLFQSTHDQSYGYSNSDLKDPYLTREQLQSRMISPSIMVPENFRK